MFVKHEASDMMKRIRQKFDCKLCLKLDYDGIGAFIAQVLVQISKYRGFVYYCRCYSN